jgi:hypothetical protein
LKDKTRKRDRERRKGKQRINRKIGEERQRKDK